MPKRIKFALTAEELQQIQNVITSHPDGRVQKRAQILYMRHLGKKVREIAEIVCMTEAAVYYWQKRWKEQGFSGVEDQKRSGRPPIGGDDFKQKLEALIDTDPSEFGYGFSVWTQERLIQHMGKETGHFVSEPTMHNRLKELGFVYRRPKHDLSNLQDKDVKKQADLMIDELKKRQNQAKSSFSLWTKQQ